MGRAAGGPKLRLIRPPEEAAAKAPKQPSPGMDDAELLTALVSGDAEAATALYDRLRPRVAATVGRLLGAADPDNDDCVQNTFVEIVRSIERYRGDCPLEHWASRIAAHVVYKHIRRRRVERRIFDGPARPSDRPEPISTTRRFVMRDLVARVRQKLTGLDEDKTYAFLLHDVLGFDLAEIAEITGVSVAAAQKRLVRGRREVHAELAADAELASIGGGEEEGS